MFGCAGVVVMGVPRNGQCQIWCARLFEKSPQLRTAERLGSARHGSARRAQRKPTKEFHNSSTCDGYLLSL